MAKIKTLKEEMLTGEKSQEQIYPVTTTEAVYTTSNEVLQDVLNDISDGNFIKDNSILERHIADQNITTTKIKNKAVTTQKIEDRAITTDKIADGSITTEKIIDGSITNDKIAIGAVDHDQIQYDAVKTENIEDDSITTDKIVNEHVTTEKLAEGAVTNDKIANDNITISKFDPELRDLINAATGLPEGMVSLIQNIDQSIQELNRTVYPFELDFDVTSSLEENITEIYFNIMRNGKSVMPDALTVSKIVNMKSDNEKIIFDTPTDSGGITSPIEGNIEEFRLTVSKEGMDEAITSVTKYIYYYGGSSDTKVSTSLINALTKYINTNIRTLNLKITTKDNDYIWLVVPSYCYLNKVTSDGFEVPMAAQQSLDTDIGEVNAYRSANPLTAQTWNLVITLKGF